VRSGRRYYTSLLRLLPADFRASRGSELLATYEEMRSELGPKPGATRLGAFYTRLSFDLLRRIRPERDRAARRARAANRARSSSQQWGGSGGAGEPSRGRHGVGHSHRPPRLNLGQVVESILRDIRMAMRSLAKRPVFLMVATLSLAIGIGANTAIFSIVHAVFIQQYPYRAPEELVRVYTHVPGRSEFGTTSFPNYRDMRDFEEGFQAAAAFKTIITRVELQDETVRVMGEGVSQNLFPMLGVLPEEDETPGTHPVMMLGHGFWRRAFGGDPGIVGRTVRIGGQPFTVIGVTPEDFRGLSGAGMTAEFFVPIVMYGVASGLTNHSHFEDRLDRRYHVVGRIAEGMTLGSAQARLEVLSRQLQEANPDIDQEWVFPMLPMQDVALDPDFDRAAQPIAAVLMAAAGLIVLLACTNLASFLLARGTNRRKEIALRMALGAGRGSLVRQVLVETVLLALFGGLAGLLLAQWTFGLIAGFPPPVSVPITLELGLNGPILLFTFAISTLAGLLLGVAPALRSTKLEVAPTLKDEMGPGRHRRVGLGNGLVAFQMALSVVLLVGGGLSVRSLGAARSAEMGFSTREAGIVWVDLALSGVPPAQYRTVTEELTLRAGALPGIEAVTSTSHIPFLNYASGGFYSIPGADPPAEGAGHNVQRAEVDPAFFETMGIPLVMGRTFTGDDRPQSPPVVIVNETAARSFWPGESPVGKELFPLGSNQGLRVVGVVGNTKIASLREPPKPLFYFPNAQRPDWDVILVARGRPAAPEVAAMLRQTVREVNPNLMIIETKTMEENIGVILFPDRMAALLLGMFGALALTLATIGLYGAVSFSVSQRTHEVGIRMSLGADAKAVMAMVMRGALAVVVIGGIVGLAAAAGLAQLIRTVLYGVGPWDPGTLLGVPLLLVCVAALAAWIPARRASRVNPVEALRSE